MRFLLMMFWCALAAAAETQHSAENALLEDVLAVATADCAAFEGGTFTASESAITRQFIGEPATFVDAAEFSCSSSASMWGGTGGTMLWVIVGGEVHEFLAHRWRVVDIAGQAVLVLAVHSSECGPSPGPCYRAYVWQDGFRTTTP